MAKPKDLAPLKSNGAKSSVKKGRSMSLEDQPNPELKIPRARSRVRAAKRITDLAACQRSKISFVSLLGISIPFAGIYAFPT